MHDGSKNADLCAYFFRRAGTLLGRHGSFGLIATNTIAQGDTRNTGLQPLLKQQWKIYDAVNSMPWPGAAAVTVSLVHAAHGNPAVEASSRLSLDGLSVGMINSRLLPGFEHDDPVVLTGNHGSSFQGCVLVGLGFTLSPDDREQLIAKNASNASRIFPYLGGEEVNTSPRQEHSRFAINFGDMTIEQAERWPDLIRIVRERVKPERDRVRREAHRKYWWHYGDKRPALYAAIAPLKRCLVTARVSKHLMFHFQPTDRILSEQLFVFAVDTHTPFAVLQSRIHECWARLLSSSMKMDLRYAASDCFETFPFPNPDPRTLIDPLEKSGHAVYEARARFMLETNQGLTKTYNALKDPASDDPRILELRTLHEALDQAVLEAYGWADLADLGVPPFCPRTPEHETALQTFADEIIDRLYLLNATRARDEQRLGLGKKPAKKPKAKKNPEPRQPRAKKAPGPSSQGGLFG